METIELTTLIAVFSEMLGIGLWALLFIALGTAVAFIALLWREKGVRAQRLLRAQLVGIAGGILALVIMVRVSASGFTDAGGPADWLLIAFVFLLGWVGSTILTYSAMGWRSLACPMRQRQATMTNSH